MDAGTAATSLIRRVRDRSWGLAVATVAGDDVVIAFDRGDDELTDSTMFQIGSITKTMTGLLLAVAVGRRELTLDTTLGDVLGADAGKCGATTLLQLATHRSGLPRLPPNLESERFDAADPYAHYTADDLSEALRTIEPPRPGAHTYSNFGFMVLGVCLARAAGVSLDVVMTERVFAPLAMTDAVCGARAEHEALPGFNTGQRVGWWHLPLAGPGGVAASIRDLAIYGQALLRPDSTPLGEAINLAVRVHAEDDPVTGLAWAHEGGGLWHNGGTGGFRSFVAVHPATGTGVALIANSGDAGSIDQAGFTTLTAMASGRR